MRVWGEGKEEGKCFRGKDAAKVSLESELIGLLLPGWRRNMNSVFLPPACRRDRERIPYREWDIALFERLRRQAFFYPWCS